jgi:hypothetical protein
MILRFARFCLPSAHWRRKASPRSRPPRKEFQESMSGVTLNGHYTRQDGSGLSDDKYFIESVTKVKAICGASWLACSTAGTT